MKAIHFALAVVMALSGLSVVPALADEVPACRLENLKLRGVPDSTKRRSELSGAAMLGKYLLVVSNEALGTDKDSYYAIQVFEPGGDDSFHWIRDERIYTVDRSHCGNADFEALALEGDRLYVVGSHSFAHKKQDSDDSYKNNRKRLLEFETTDDRCIGSRTLYQFSIDSQARLTDPDNPRRIELAPVLMQSKLLSTFSAIPSKENGIDIEGLAVKDGMLYLGFRGPVLRQNYVPVIRIDPSGRREAEFLFVTLGGRGIRDMVSIDEGFLIIGGPSGDQKDISYNIYHWDGKDMVRGHSRPAGGVAKPLCSLPLENGDAKAEGIAIVSRTEREIEAVIVYDGDQLIAKRARIRLD